MKRRGRGNSAARLFIVFLSDDDRRTKFFGQGMEHDAVGPVRGFAAFEKPFVKGKLSVEGIVERNIFLFVLSDVTDSWRPKTSSVGFDFVRVQRGAFGIRIGRIVSPSTIRNGPESTVPVATPVLQDVVVRADGILRTSRLFA